jgi:hypothetical protein
MKQPKRVGPKPKEAEQAVEVDPAVLVMQLHNRMLEAARIPLTEARNAALAQGLSAVGMFGHVFDLSDRLVPGPIRNSPASQDALRQAGPGKSPLLISIAERGSMLELLDDLAWKLSGKPKPMIISNHVEDPPLLAALRSQHDPNLLPVIIIAGGRLSVKALPVNSVVDATGKPTFTP